MWLAKLYSLSPSFTDITGFFWHSITNLVLVSGLYVQAWYMYSNTKKYLISFTMWAQQRNSAFHSDCVQNQLSSEAKYLNGCNSPPGNRKMTIQETTNWVNTPHLLCKLTSIYTRMHVLRDKGAGPDRRDLVWISDLAVILLFASNSWDWKSYTTAGAEKRIAMLHMCISRAGRWLYRSAVLLWTGGYKLEQDDTITKHLLRVTD